MPLISDEKSPKILSALQRRRLSGQIEEGDSAQPSGSSTNPSPNSTLENFSVTDVTDITTTPDTNLEEDPSIVKDKDVTVSDTNTVPNEEQGKKTSPFINSNVESKKSDSNTAANTKEVKPESAQSVPPEELRGFIFDYVTSVSKSPNVPTSATKWKPKPLPYGKYFVYYKLSDSTNKASEVRFETKDDPKNKWIGSVGNGLILNWEDLPTGASSIGGPISGEFKYGVPSNYYLIPNFSSKSSIVSEFNSMIGSVSSPLDAALLFNTLETGIMNEKYPFSFKEGGPLHHVIQHINGWVDEHSTVKTFYNHSTTTNIPSWRANESWCGAMIYALSVISGNSVDYRVTGTGGLYSVARNSSSCLKLQLGKDILSDGTVTNSGWSKLNSMNQDSPSGAVMFRYNETTQSGHVELVTQIRVTHSGKLVVGTIGGNTHPDESDSGQGTEMSFKLYIGKSLAKFRSTNNIIHILYESSFGGNLGIFSWKDSPKFKESKHEWYYGFQPNVQGNAILKEYIERCKDESKYPLISRKALTKLFARPSDWVDGVPGNDGFV